jgi:hypothetical protein
MQASRAVERASFPSRLRGRAAAVLVVVYGVCALVPGAASAGTLDQQQLVSNQGQIVDTTQSVAQTFTAGLTGGIDQIDLMVACAGFCPASAPLSVEIRNVSAGVPGPTLLGTSSIPASAVIGTPAFVPFTFAAHAPVSAGTQYAIVASSAASAGTQYHWSDESPAPYAGGASWYLQPPGTTWGSLGDIDQTFKTYVAPVPSVTAPTGLRAAALKKCKKKHSKKAKKKCRKKARKLPV